MVSWIRDGVIKGDAQDTRATNLRRNYIRIQSWYEEADREIPSSNKRSGNAVCCAQTFDAK